MHLYGTVLFRRIPMVPVSFLIKPASSLCNMGCNYCFYHDIADTRSSVKASIMAEPVRDRLIAEAIHTAQGGPITFAFQGGEPTLAGLSFFRDFVKEVAKQNRYQSKVAYALQTNGLVIDSDWAEFFHKNNFLIGLSVDGTQSIHDSLRKDRKEQGTYERVMTTANIFDTHKVEYNILTVVTPLLAKSIDTIYKEYKHKKFRYLQFIPCLDPTSQHGKDYSIVSKEYGEFLIDLFDLWYEDIMKNDGVSIRFFDNLLGIYLGYPPESCDMVGSCSIQKVVESDGSVFPCDFYTQDQDVIGNILTDSIEKLHTNRRSRKFLQASRDLPESCRECNFVPVCRNGCQRHRNSDTHINRYCDAYKAFHTHSSEKFRSLAADIMKNQRRQS